MTRPRLSPFDAAGVTLLLALGAALWGLHAEAVDLGGRSAVLDDATAQAAVAARELAWHGRLATPYTLPLGLALHASPPWPLTGVPPGMVLIGALVFELVPAQAQLARPEPRAGLTLVLPFCCFLLLGGCAYLATRHLLARHAPAAGRWVRHGAPLVIGLVVLLDPQAQRFAAGGLPALPLAVGLLMACFGLAMGGAAVAPLRFGLWLGATGLFGDCMLWLAPVFALAAAACVPPGRRAGVAGRVLLGYALVLAPWWAYRWRAFGSPLWDPAWLQLWDRVEGRSWLALAHVARLPVLPGGVQAARLLGGKLAHALPALLLALFTGPRALWLGALAVWLAARPPRPPAAAGAALLAAVALGLLAAALTVPWLGGLLPARMLSEPAGILALWALVAAAPGADARAAAGAPAAPAAPGGEPAAGAPAAADPGTLLGPRTRAALVAAIALLAVGWGAFATARALAAERAQVGVRALPTSAALTSLGLTLRAGMDPRAPVMSNLGAALAWQTLHPVVHLALAPEDVPTCRRRLDFREVVLAFRRPEDVWPAWREIAAEPGAAQALPALACTSERRYRSPDGFTFVWLRLGPLAPESAARPPLTVPARPA